MLTIETLRREEPHREADRIARATTAQHLTSPTTGRPCVDCGDPATDIDQCSSCATATRRRSVGAPRGWTMARDLNALMASCR